MPNYKIGDLIITTGSFLVKKADKMEISNGACWLNWSDPIFGGIGFDEADKFRKATLSDLDTTLAYLKRQKEKIEKNIALVQGEMIKL